MLRIVEKALLDHRIPGVIPQIINETTIRVPMAKYVSAFAMRNLSHSGMMTVFRTFAIL